METTCGCVIFNKDNKFLIAHPTGSRWNCWSIPKGIKEPYETYINAVIREVSEETNLFLLKKDIYEFGKYRYNNNKKELKGFCYFLNKNLDVSYLKCNSMVNHIKENQCSFPEVDAFSWLSFKEINILHPTQKKLLLDIEQFFS